MLPPTAYKASPSCAFGVALVVEFRKIRQESWNLNDFQNAAHHFGPALIHTELILALWLASGDPCTNQNQCRPDQKSPVVGCPPAQIFVSELTSQPRPVHF